MPLHRVYWLSGILLLGKQGYFELRLKLGYQVIIVLSNSLEHSMLSVEICNTILLTR